MGECVFCELPASRVEREISGWRVVRDAFPVTEGHTLLIAPRHVGYLRELTDAERAALLPAVGEVQAELIDSCGVSDFTVGINDGPAAGQTVPHLHLHVIPRRPGDVPEPRGGIRGVIPGRATYG